MSICSTPGVICRFFFFERRLFFLPTMPCCHHRVSRLKPVREEETVSADKIQKVMNQHLPIVFWLLLPLLWFQTAAKNYPSNSTCHLSTIFKSGHLVRPTIELRHHLGSATMQKSDCILQPITKNFLRIYENYKLAQNAQTPPA